MCKRLLLLLSGGLYCASRAAIASILDLMEWLTHSTDSVTWMEVRQVAKSKEEWSRVSIMDLPKPHHKYASRIMHI